VTFRYFPYKDNPYHELRIAPGSAGGAELIVLKDRGSRAESITVQASDIERVCAEIRKAAGEGDAR
jgi:hypothetical protein